MCLGAEGGSAADIENALRVILEAKEGEGGARFLYAGERGFGVRAQNRSGKAAAMVERE